MTEAIETSELVAFTRTVEAKSLSRAAAELGAPRATIGRRLARLEQRLGVRLLRRTTRALALTDAGEAFYRHARIVLAGLPQRYWPKAGGGKIAIEGSFVSNDITLLLDAAVRGLGIAVLPALLVGVALEHGALVRVLPELIHAESRVSVVYQEKELLPPQVRAFIDVLVAWAPIAIHAARLAGRRWALKPEGQTKKPPRPKPRGQGSRINRR